MTLKPLLMRHSIDELFGLIYRYYPRGVERYDPAMPATEEYRRRVAARRIAAKEYGRFRALLTRLRAKFPDCQVLDQGLYHPKGNFDACCSAKLVLPTLSPQAGQHALHFQVSFLAPYYILCSVRVLYVKRNDDKGGYDEDRELRYALNAEEQPYAEAITAELKATYGAEAMPSALRERVVPEVAVAGKPIGYATVFDCLFMPNEELVARPGARP